MSNLRKNYLYNVGYQLLNIIVPIITTPYLTRIIGAEKLGLYSYTQSIAYYFVLIAMLGLGVYGNRSIAVTRLNKQKMSKTFWGIFIVQFISSSVMSVIYIIYVVLFSENTILAAIWALYVLSSILDISWFYFGIEAFKITVTRNIFIKILSVITIFLVVKSEEDLWKYVLIISLGILINQAILWIFLFKFIRWEKNSRRDVLLHLKPIFLLFIPVVAVSVYTILDKIMIGQMSSMIENGYFDNAQKIMIIPTSLITALGVVMLPRISSLVKSGDLDKVNAYLTNSMVLTMFLSSGFAFGIAGISTVFAPTFFGSEFVPSGKLMTVLAISIVFIAWANVIRTQYLIPKFKDKVYIYSVIIGAVINFCLNIWMIPRYGALGACIGTVCAEFSVAFYQTWEIRKEVSIKSFVKISIPFLVIGFFMFTILRVMGIVLESSVLTLILQILIGSMIYITIVFFYLIKSNNDYGLLIKKTIGKRG